MVKTIFNTELFGNCPVCTIVNDLAVYPEGRIITAQYFDIYQDFGFAAPGMMVIAAKVQINRKCKQWLSIANRCDNGLMKD